MHETGRGVWPAILASKPEDWRFDDCTAVLGPDGRVRLQVILGGEDVEDDWAAPFSEAFRFGYLILAGTEPQEYLPMVMLNGGKAAIPEPNRWGEVPRGHVVVATLLNHHDPSLPLALVRRAGLRVVP